LFRFENRQLDGLTLLSLHGRLHAVNAGPFKTEVVALAESRAVRVVVDVSSLSYIDSTGVGVLISLFKRVRLVGGSVCFTGLSGQPLEVFRVLRLERALELFPSVSEAIEGIQKA
jgi:anti-sigma B factor antagonist